VEDFADRAEAGIGEVPGDSFERALRRGRVAVNAVMGERVGAEQPGPDRALVIGAVAVPDAAAAARAKPGRTRRQRAQAERRHQRGARVEHGALRRWIEWRRP